MTVRLRRFSARVMRQPSDWALLLFLLSAVLGVLVAADRDAAISKLALIAGALLVYLIFIALPQKGSMSAVNQIDWLRWMLCVLPALFAVYFLLTNDWAGRIGKITFLDPVMRWFSAWQPRDVFYQLNSNAAGGVIASLIPLQAVALRGMSGRYRMMISAALLMISVAGLILSASRGAWFALAIIIISWGLWKLVQYIGARRRHRTLLGRIFPDTVTMIVSLSVICVVTLTPLGDSLLSLRADRVEVWNNSLNLLTDYPLTGVGPGNFGITYSSYVSLVPVIDFTHAHSLYLDIWLEQGLLGVTVFGFLIVLAVTRARTGNWRQNAALASLAVILLHGLVDDAFYGYEGLGLPFMLIPFALLFRPAVQPAVAPSTWLVRLWPFMALAGSAICLIGAIILSPVMRAVFLSNLGALMQSRAELSIYRWPLWPMQDAIRHKQPDTMAPVIEIYRAALAQDRLNATANRRLGQIELAMGAYDSACEHLYTAYTAAPGQRATRQLVGECDALAGNTQGAVALWRTIDTSEGQLTERLRWYSYYLGDNSRSALMAQAITEYHQP